MRFSKPSFSRLNVRVLTSVYEEFSREVELQGRSVSDVVRVLLMDYVDQCREARERAAIIRRQEVDGGGSEGEY